VDDHDLPDLVEDEEESLSDEDAWLKDKNSYSELHEELVCGH
jgi:hypothetical protein